MGEFHSDLAIVLDGFAGGAAGNHTVTGIKLGDKIKSVVNVADGVDLTSEFSITAADTINNAGGTSTAGDIVLVLYVKSSVYGKSMLDPSDPNYV